MAELTQLGRARVTRFSVQRPRERRAAEPYTRPRPLAQTCVDQSWVRLLLLGSPAATVPDLSLEEPPALACLPAATFPSWQRLPEASRLHPARHQRPCDAIAAPAGWPLPGVAGGHELPRPDPAGLPEPCPHWSVTVSCHSFLGRAQQTPHPRCPHPGPSGHSSFQVDLVTSYLRSLPWSPLPRAAAPCLPSHSSSYRFLGLAQSPRPYLCFHPPLHLKESTVVTTGIMKGTNGVGDSKHACLVPVGPRWGSVSL